MAKRIDDPLLRSDWTVEEFLRFDDGSDRRYQLVRGNIVAMSPPATNHGRLVMRLGAQLSAQLRRPCEPITEAGIRPRDRDDTWWQADLAVTCARPRQREGWVEAPRLIVEVRSPSTGRRDLFEKLLDYQQISTVADILMLDDRAARVEHFTRGEIGWLQQTHVGGGELRLVGLGAVLDLADLYDGLLDDETAAEAGG